MFPSEICQIKFGWTQSFIDIVRFMRSMIYYRRNLALDKNKSHITVMEH